MVVLLPYPNNMTYPMMGEDYNVFEQAENIWEYVNRVCSGPWESGATDILQRGVRVRLGNEKDLFMLKMKYGLDIVQNV
jgi:hypothetical protein